MKKLKQSLSNYLPREPRNINESAWYYIEPKGMIIFVEARKMNNEWIDTTQVIIPWSRIEKALKYLKDGIKKQNKS